MSLSRGKDITIIGYQDWCYAEDNGLNHRDLHFTVELANLAEVRTVLFVNRPVSLVEQIIRRKKWKLRTGELVDSGFGYRLYKLPGAKSLYVLSTWLPDIVSPVVLGRIWWNRAFKNRSTIRRIAAARKKLDVRADAMLLCTPFAVSAIDTIPHKTLAFDVIDNFAKHLQLRESERGFCRTAYERINESAKLITCVSMEALELFSNRGATLVVRNGVDRAWLSLIPPRPPELLKMKGKVVGFGATFTKKFNGRFLAEVAKSMPDVDFVLMGKVLDPDFFLPFKGVGNVHYLGFRDFEALPSYYYHFDAGLILYHKDKEHDGDPLKLYEYLSLGTPVVSLSAKWALERFKGVLLIADTVAHFSATLKSVLESDREGWRAKCKNAILEEDFWDRKAKEISDAIGLKEGGLEKAAVAFSGESGE